MVISLPDFANIWNKIVLLFQGVDFFIMLRIMAYIVLGILLTLYLCRIVGNVSEKKLSAHHSQLLRRLTFYTGLTCSFIFPLTAAGVNIAGLLSAAGIAAGIITAAVAFAAQTSISNFLSGVFLIAEKPFVVGDYVSANDILGEVLSIGLLSVKIRTKDNTFIRIPNEALLKAQFRNLSRFPIRRVDIKLRVSFSEDLERIKKILMDVAGKNPLCLVSPAPEFSFIEFGEAAILLQFMVWGKQASFSLLQTQIQMEIQSAFKTHHIQLPAIPPTPAK
jgi:small-conductance mechanosensitive channel